MNQYRIMRFVLVKPKPWVIYTDMDYNTSTDVFQKMNFNFFMNWIDTGLEFKTCEEDVKDQWRIWHE